MSSSIFIVFFFLLNALDMSVHNIKLSREKKNHMEMQENALNRCQLLLFTHLHFKIIWSGVFFLFGFLFDMEFKMVASIAPPPMPFPRDCLH